ncbi:MAG: hypothetical protein ACJ79A_03090 [Gemmatimonadaceae bacterium]
MLQRRLLIAITLAVWARSSAQAQPPAESGIARDAKHGAPLACLHVALLDAEDHSVAHTVTDSAGTFVLVAPAAGVYRVGFEIFGWERLAGPADTLHDGEMKERVYPLTFGESIGRDFPDVAELRRHEDAGFRSAVATKPDAELRFPLSMKGSATPGSVVAQYVVDVSGRVRADSWRAVASSHPDYLAALRAHAPAMRYQPARLDGRPVCQLVRNELRFEWVGPVVTMTLFN